MEDTTSRFITGPLVPIAAALASAAMTCLPHPNGEARVVQVLFFAATGDSLLGAAALSSLAVGVVTGTAYALFSRKLGRFSGNIAAAVAFGVYALVFFAWTAGPLIG